MRGSRSRLSFPCAPSGVTYPLEVASAPTRLLVDLGDGTRAQLFDRATFTSISAFLGGWDDTFSGNATNGALTIPMRIDGASCNDTMTGGAADDALIGGRGDDLISGGDGSDLILAGDGTDIVDGQGGTDTEILRTGRDVARWLPGEGDDNIDGGAGNDALVFDGANAHEKIAVGVDWAHTILTRDVANIRTDMASFEALRLATLGGTDTVALGDLSGTDLDEAAIDLAGLLRRMNADVELISSQPDTIEYDILLRRAGSDVTDVARLSDPTARSSPRTPTARPTSRKPPRRHPDRRVHRTAT